MSYDRLRKILIYVFYLFLLTLLQMTLLPRLMLFGARPTLFPAFVAVIAVFEGGWLGGVFGFAAGLCADALTPGFQFFFAPVLLGSGALIGWLSKSLYRRALPIMLIWAGASHLAVNVLLFFVFFFLPGRAGFAAFSAVSLSEVLFSLLLMPFLYLPLRSNYRHWREEGESLTVDS